MRCGIAILLGIVLGVLFAHLVTGGWITLFVWVVVGLVLGFYARNKKESLLVGTVYGFVISFAFLIADYNGSVAIVRRLFPFALLSLVGLVGGAILGFIGFLLRKFLPKKK